MDLNPSPERSPPDHELHTQRDSHSPPSQMATMVIAQAQVHNMPGPLAGVNKRYRPAPAKTFQCRGYGECRMVFSRSEHLARHIRKHTGERPFSCHCGKQFSRLDNLRQHAQTVHADKQDQNERMMRDLTSLHATMAAANKAGNSRGGRRPPANNGANQQQGNASPSSPTGDSVSLNLIKQEDLGGIPMHQRPGTTTGYEGDHFNYHQQQHHQGSWHVQQDMDRPSPRSSGPTHSFRDPSQSFLAPSQSFLPYTAGPLSFLPDPTAPSQRPSSSSGRPPTASGPPDPSRSLPPLASVLPASLTPPPQFAASSQQQQPQHVLSFPSNHRTANRPGTAPPLFANGLGVSIPAGYAGRSELGGAATHDGSSSPGSSPSAGHDSPFYFHPPPPPQPQQLADSVNPRKRGFGAPDGPQQPSGGGGEYDYGSESRPQSRRLSVMELCNDNAASEFLLSQRGVQSRPSTVQSRPTTSSGLVSSASALHIFDRGRTASTSPQPGTAGAGASPTLLARAAHAAAKAGGAAGAGQQSLGGGQHQHQQSHQQQREDFTGGRVSVQQQQRVPSGATTVLSGAGGGGGGGGGESWSPTPAFSTPSPTSSVGSALASPVAARPDVYGEQQRYGGVLPPASTAVGEGQYDYAGRGGYGAFELPGRELGFAGREFGFAPAPGRGGYELPGRGGYELPGRGGYGAFDVAPGREFGLPGRGYAGEFDFAGRGYQHGYAGFEYEYDGFEFDQAGQVRGGVGGAYPSVAFGMRV